ncbi:MAG: hypothetical protein ACT4P4_23430 [Betaproteobacteria bacterium]
MIPAPYQALAADALGSELPAEKIATCGRCVMLPKADAPERAGRTWFDSSTKCCTYLPRLPNFVAGRILRDTDAELAPGRRSVEARIAAREAVTPLGLGQTADFVGRYTLDKFGTDATLRCPHYVQEAGGCAIWRHREPVCATYFCIHERGERGDALWEALRDFLLCADRAVALHCLLELDTRPQAMALAVRADPAALKRGPIAPPPLGEAEYAALWGPHAGREEEWYVKTAAHADALAVADIRRLGGSELAARGALLRDAHARLMEEGLAPTARLHIRKLERHPAGKGFEELKGYKVASLRLPENMAAAVASFGGLTVAQAIELARVRGLRLTDRNLRTLVDFGVVGIDP